MAMNCPSCGRANEDQARFCSRCGGEIAAACPSCGGALPADAVFCRTCGAALGAAAAAPTELVPATAPTQVLSAAAPPVQAGPAGPVPPTPPPAMARGGGGPPRRGAGPALIVTIIVLVIAAAAAAAIFFFILPSGSHDHGDETPTPVASSGGAAPTPSAAGAITPTPTATTATMKDPIVLNTKDGGQVAVTPLAGGAAYWTSTTTHKRLRYLYMKLSIKNTGDTPVSDSPIKCSRLIDSSGLVYPAVKADRKKEIGDFTLQPGERVQGYVYFTRTSKLKARGRFPDFRYAPDRGMSAEVGRWTLADYTIPRL